MKNNRKIWQVEEEKNLVSVGIIGEGKDLSLLEKKLSDKNCKVIVSPIFSTEFLGCKYIFQFGDFAHFGKVAGYCRKNNVRLLVVFGLPKKEQLKVTNIFQMEVARGLRAKIIKVGNISSWEGDKLVEILLWAMYSGDIKNNIIDFSKEKLFEFKKSTKTHHFRPRRVPSWSKYLLFLIILTLPLIFLFFNFWLMKNNLSALEKDMGQGMWENAGKDVESWQINLAINTKMLDIAQAILGPFGEKGLSSWQRLNEIFGKSLEAGQSVIAAHEIFTLEKKNIYSNNQPIDKDNIKKLDELVDVVDKDLKKIEDDTNEEEMPFFPKKNILEKTKKARKQIVLVKGLMPLIIKVTSDETSHKYLILFQNNLELRPTGGFIGSYGILNTKGGNILSLAIHDVYEADGQLKAHVDPPLPIRTIMSQPNWFLRDSNFDPDFSTSAQQAEWFIDKETGEKVDGVIGMNLNLLKDLINVLGGVYLPDYGENITADNLFIKSTIYTQKGFFPGSSAKKDFLGSLANVILFTFTDSEKVNWPKVAEVISTSLEEKNLLFYFNREEMQKAIEERGWGGRMVDINCGKENCFGDYLSIIETNLGVNKSNLYISKEVSVAKKIGADGSVFSEVKIGYKNNSPENIFPAGDYKNYIRIYMPKDSLVSAVSIDGEKVQQIDQKDYGKDKQEVGFFVEVVPQGKREIIIDYMLSTKYFLTDKSYQFFYQKQPGEGVTLSLNFDFPEGWKIKPVNFSPTKGTAGFGYNTDTSFDRVFIFELGPAN